MEKRIEHTNISNVVIPQNTINDTIIIVNNNNNNKESKDHINAKSIVSKNRMFDFYHTCPLCKEEYKVDICNKNNISEIEYHWKEQDDKLYIPDVVFLNEDDRKLVSIVEIYKICLFFLSKMV